MVSIQLGEQNLTGQFMANAAVEDGEVVAVTGANAVEPATDASTQQAVGVADMAAEAGEAFEVVLLGRKTVVADGPVDAGQPVRAAATPGRVVAEAAAPASHSHTMPTHGHNVPADGSGNAANASFDGAGNLAVGGGGSIESSDPGDTNASDSAPEHARVVGKAIGSADAAGENLDVLVVLTG